VLVCGPELLATLIGVGLGDELMLLAKPTVQGRGLALFPDLQRQHKLTLLDTRVCASSTVLHHYRAGLGNAVTPIR
jgi:riboflavin biosynthesis pyrimidine reductase